MSRRVCARVCALQSCADQTSAATDYRKWDMWCPEDEEDDLINSITPNTPAFRALEKDIDERHNRYKTPHMYTAHAWAQPTATMHMS